MKIEVDSEPKLPVTDVEKSAVTDLLTFNPNLLSGAEAHAARVMPPAEAPPKMTPAEVQSEIDRICGRGRTPSPVLTQGDKVQQLRSQYEAELAKRQSTSL